MRAIWNPPIEGKLYDFNVYLFLSKHIKGSYGFLKKHLWIHCCEHLLWFMALWNTMNRSMFTFRFKKNARVTTKNSIPSSLPISCAVAQLKRAGFSWKLTSFRQRERELWRIHHCFHKSNIFNVSIPICRGQNPYEKSPLFLIAAYSKSQFSMNQSQLHCEIIWVNHHMSLEKFG